MPALDHFMVLTLEHRSFDHRFGFFSAPAEETIKPLHPAIIEARFEAANL
jgi:hypothetical protein